MLLQDELKEEVRKTLEYERGIVAWPLYWEEDSFGYDFWTTTSEVSSVLKEKRKNDSIF